MPTRRALLIALAALPLTPAAAAGASAHDFSFDAIDGGTIRLADHAGRPILVVNTASLCGFTPQYEGLMTLWGRYREAGLVVIGVPSDDFGGQELGTEAEVRDFCDATFRIDFPLAAITPVSGPGAHPFYAWAREVLGADAAPRWNFHKYLVAPDGTLAAWFPTRTEPTDPRLVAEVERLLAGA